MKIKLSASLFGFVVGGYTHEETIEIDIEEIVGLSEKEIAEYIDKCVWEYIREELEWGWRIEEEEE